MTRQALTDWLRAYADARQDYDDQMQEAAFSPNRYARVMPARPLDLQFSIDSNGNLCDWQGNHLGNVMHLSPADARMIGINPDRNPMPRRNPDLTRIQADREEAERQHQALHGAPEGETYVITETTTEPITIGTPPPAAARPGDVITVDGVATGLLGLDGRGNAVLMTNSRTRAILATTPAEPGRSMASVVQDVARANGVDVRPAFPDSTPISQQFGTLPAEYQPSARYGEHPPHVQDEIDAALRREARREARANAGTPTVIPADAPGANGLMASMNAAMANALTPALANIREVAATIQGNPPASPAEETYSGPRMLATIGTDSGAADRFTTYTRTAQAAAERAAVEYGLRPRYRTMAGRLITNEVTAHMVDRETAHVDRFLISGYGLELNEEALTAVTAMTTTMIRQAVVSAADRAEQADARANALRVDNDALREAMAAVQARAARAEGAISATPDVEAAIEAAKAWKDTPLTESVAKRDSFLHLLDTLNRMAG